MLPSPFAIADTCFLIDWARYRRRNVLFKLFRTVFVSENVLTEIRSERTITWISDSLAKDRLSLYTPTPNELEEARELIEESRLQPRLPSIDLPEALCLVIGKKRGYVVLTENRGALLAPVFIKRFKNVKVWRALEVLLNVIKAGHISINCNNPEEIFTEYSEDTLHIFPKRALRIAVNEVKKICMERK